MSQIPLKFVTNVGTANGLATLDGSGKIPSSQLPSTVLEYQGLWDPSTNTPVLQDLTGTNGFVYQVSVAFAGPIIGLSNATMVNFQVGNLVIYSGTLSQWEQAASASGVVSVNGAQGAVTVNAINQLTGDVTASAASGSQSKATSLVATSNSTLTTLSALSLPGAQVTGNIAGNAANITATSNSTLTTLSALSLPYSQLTGAPAALTFADSLVNTSGTVTLKNDSASPIASQYYGTNASSVLGYFALPSVSPLTTKGDTYVFSTVNARLPVGTDYQGIVADSSQTTGLRYQTQWQGNKNYIIYHDFENQQTTGYSLGTTGTLTNGIPTGSPSFGSGASGNLSLAIETSGQLAGSASLGYISSAATTAGNMVATQAFTIDIEDQAQVLNYSIAYKAVSGASGANWSGTSSSSFAVAIYDVTNSAYIIPQKPFNFIQSSGVGKATGSFQTSSNGTSYRLVVYNANATSGAITLYFDDFVVTPAQVSSPSNVISWNGTQTSQAVTANVTDIAFTTVKDSSAAWNGTQYVVPVAGDYAFLLGGIAPNSGCQLSAYKNGSQLQSIVAQATSNNQTSGCILIPNLKPGDTISLRANQSVTVATGNLGIFQLGGGSVGAAGQVVAAELNTLSSTTLTANSAVTFTTLGFDTSGSVSSLNKFTAPVTGTYLVSAYSDITTAAGTRLYVAKNGTFTQTVANTITSAASTVSAGGAILIQLNAGDFIQLSYNANGTLNSTSVNLNIFLIQGPSAANSGLPNVNARYFASATSLSGSLATVSWTTKDFDTASAMSAGTYTIPVTGKYQFNTALAISGTFALNGTADLQVQKNGSVISEDNFIAGGANTSIAVNASDIISCLAGDTIRVQVSTSASGPAIVSSNSKNYFSIALVGQ